MKKFIKAISIFSLNLLVVFCLLDFGISKFFQSVTIEMKKVSWPDWPQLRGSTYVVITFSIIISVFLFFIDRMLSTMIQVIM